MKILKNFFFHGAVLLVMLLVTTLDVVITGANSISEFTVIGKVAAGIFMIDLCGYVFYVTILKMVFKVK